jgi:glycine/D-amino acid oxidase-like deaminating enzyme/nitrite reductase/ring-hydroxylating ferredoxin subunit
MNEAMAAQPALSSDLKADVCVVGAGIAGMSTAYLLGRAGKKVVVLDDGSIGGGQTQRTTAHLASAIDDRYMEIERLHGEEGARLAADSHASAIDHIERIVSQENLDCAFSRLDGYLFLAPGQGPDLLDHELEAALRAGLQGVQRLDRVPLIACERGPCLRFPRQGQLHPLRYLAGLARGIQRDGGRIFSSAHVESVQGGDPALVRTDAGYSITAEAVVVATNSPINDRFEIHTKQSPYLTYAISAPMAKGSLVPALYWDTGNPYHYVRLQTGSAGTDYLIIGGEDHKTGQEDDAQVRYDRLEAWARERFPAMGAVQNRWSGQILETIDGLAYIGRNPMDEANVYIATGDSGMGMTHGTIAGILLTDLILGLPNPWAPLYDPARKTLKAAGAFTRENAHMAWEYTRWLTPGDVPTEDQIAPGHGAVIRRGLSKVAVYRDREGRLHERSAVCPHLKGIVAWNSSEHTWDCPIHGSRFDCLGKVLNGPAIHELGPP